MKLLSLASIGYTAFGVLIGFCFPVAALLFLITAGKTPYIGFIQTINAAHTSQPLLYIIDTTPLFMGLFAFFIGLREDQLTHVNKLLDEDVRRVSEEAHLLAVTFNTGLATIITDAKGNIVRVNKAFTRITGYRPDEVKGKNPKMFQSGRHDKHFYNHLWSCLQTQGYWQGEIWNRNKAGTIYPLWQAITVVYNHDGEIQHYVSVFYDISENKKLEESRNSLLEILESTPDFIAMARPDGTMLYINRGGRNLTGLPVTNNPLSREDLINLSGGKFAHPDWASHKVMNEGFPAAIKYGIWQDQTALINAEGEEIPVSQIILAHYDENGNTTHLSTIMRDISELKRLESKLYYMATHDELTGLKNRRHFEQCLNEEIYRAQRYSRPFSIIMFDIDHFKFLNDKFGHEAGDQVLILLADVITKQLRQADIFSRWGGEEFMILLPETAIDNAKHVAETIGQMVSQTLFKQADRVTISLGVTEYQASESIDSLLTRVDDALYRAKGDGRNNAAFA